MKHRLLRFLFPLIGAILFFAALGFAVKNSEPVQLRYYLGVAWQTPLVVALLVAFFIGAVAGVAASFSYVYRQRREILNLKRDRRSRMRSKTED